MADIDQKEVEAEAEGEEDYDDEDAEDGEDDMEAYMENTPAPNDLPEETPLSEVKEDHMAEKRSNQSSKLTFSTFGRRNVGAEPAIARPQDYKTAKAYLTAFIKKQTMDNKPDSFGA